MIAFLVVFIVFPLCKGVLYSRDVPLGVECNSDLTFNSLRMMILLFLLDMTLI